MQRLDMESLKMFIKTKIYQKEGNDLETKKLCCPLILYTNFHRQKKSCVEDVRLQVFSRLRAYVAPAANVRWPTGLSPFQTPLGPRLDDFE